MALTDITERILSDAEHLAAAMKKEADADATKLLTENAEAMILEDKEDQESLTELLAQNSMKIKALATQDAKRKIEEKKSEILDAVFAEAEHTIVNADDTVYTRFLTTLVRDVPADFKATICAPKNRHEVTRRVCATHGIEILEMKEASFAAGLRIVSDTFEYDFTLPTVLKGIRDTEDVTVANMLFGKK